MTINVEDDLIEEGVLHDSEWAMASSCGTVSTERAIEADEILYLNILNDESKGVFIYPQTVGNTESIFFVSLAQEGEANIATFDIPKEEDVEKDIVFSMIPKLKYSVKIQINKITRAKPKIIIDY